MAVSKIPHEVEETDIEGLGVARIGQRVRHPTFGSGVIEGLYIFEDGTKTVRVNFKSGSKALHPQYAKLTQDKPKPGKRWWPW